MPSRSLVPSIAALALILAACSGSQDPHAASSPSATDPETSTRPSAPHEPGIPTNTSTQPGSGATSDPCMSLIADVPADPASVHGSHRSSAASALDRLAKELGPTVTYDYTFDGPVTKAESFAGKSVYAIVLGKYSQVNGDTVRRSVEILHLRVPVAILRSCVSRPELQRIRQQITAYVSSFQLTSATGISTARGQVEVTVNSARHAQLLRHKYGDRVHVQVGYVTATAFHIAVKLVWTRSITPGFWANRKKVVEYARHAFTSKA